MKRVSSILSIVILFTAIGITQNSPAPSDPPRLTDQQKLQLREIQRKLDKTEKDITALNLNFERVQKQAQQQMDVYVKEQQQATAELDKAIERMSQGVDPKNWVLNRETLDYGPPAVQAAKKNDPKKE